MARKAMEVRFTIKKMRHGRNQGKWTMTVVMLRPWLGIYTSSVCVTWEQAMFKLKLYQKAFPTLTHQPKYSAKDKKSWPYSW